MEYLRWYDQTEQVALIDDAVHDARPVLPTGFASLDVLLRRGGILPGNLVLLGGRTGTRKSTIMHNVSIAMARNGIPVGLVGLDETGWMNVAKQISVYSGRSLDWLDEEWDSEAGHALRDEWQAFARGKVHYFGGVRPDLSHLDAAMEQSSLGDSESPRCLFVDYLGLLTRDRRFGPSDTQRIPRLVEELQVWSNDNGLAIVLLHQLSRNDEYGSANARNAGHLPVTLAQLRQGGEEQADIVVGCFRKSLDPLGNMDIGTARSVLGPDFDETSYYEAVARVEKNQNITHLQLLKNRPGTHVERKGIELLSPNDSMRIIEKESDVGRAGHGVASRLGLAAHQGAAN